MNSDVFIVRTVPRYPDFPYDSDPHVLTALQSLFSLWGKDPENPFQEARPRRSRGAEAQLGPS